MTIVMRSKHRSRKTITFLWCITPWLLMFFSTETLNTNVQILIYLLFVTSIYLFAFITERLLLSRSLNVFTVSYFFMFIIISIQTVRSVSLYPFYGYTIMIYCLLSILFVCVSNTQALRMAINNLILFSVLIAFLQITMGVIETNTIARITIKLLNGKVVDPNFLMFFVVFPAIITLKRFLFSYGKKKICHGFLAALQLFSILWSGSRGGLVGYFIGAFFIFIYLLKNDNVSINKRFNYVMIVLSIAIVAFILANAYLPDEIKVRAFDMTSFQDENVRGRLISWTIALNFIQNKPILGYGMNNFAELSLQYYGTYRDVHNTYLRFLFMSGIVGVLPLVSIIVSFVKQNLKSNNLLILSLGVSFFAQALFTSCTDKLLFWYPLMLLCAITLKVNRDHVDVHDIL